MTFGFGAILFPLLGQLGRITEGWRIGFFTMGGLSVLGGILIWLFFQDPGRGASERELAGLEAEKREAYGIVRLSEIRELLRIPTFVLMLVSRLLSGHLLLFSFGVVYMVDVFNYDTATATLLLSPLILFNTIGNVIGGLISDSINKRSPRVGRILIMQLIQFFFAILAFFGLQFDWGNSWIFAVFFAGLGFLQGLGPGINRPIIMAVTPPEMRATAFALFVSVIEAFGWAIYNLLGGFLSERFGLQPVFLVVLVGLMLANALFIFTIYRPYPRDVEKIHRLLQARHQQLTEAP